MQTQILQFLPSCQDRHCLYSSLRTEQESQMSLDILQPQQEPIHKWIKTLAWAYDKAVFAPKAQLSIETFFSYKGLSWNVYWKFHLKKLLNLWCSVKLCDLVPSMRAVGVYKAHYTNSSWPQSGNRAACVFCRRDTTECGERTVKNALKLWRVKFVPDHFMGFC